MVVPFSINEGNSFGLDLWPVTPLHVFQKPCIILSWFVSYHVQIADLWGKGNWSRKSPFLGGRGWHPLPPRNLGFFLDPPLQVPDGLISRESRLIKNKNISVEQYSTNKIFQILVFRSCPTGRKVKFISHKRIHKIGPCWSYENNLKIHCKKYFKIYTICKGLSYYYFT